MKKGEINLNNSREQLYINFLKTKERLTVYELSICLDRSPQTIDNWYRWKRDNPDNRYAKLLPDYIQEGSRQTRFWRGKDVKKLMQFRDNAPHGMMATVTQKYVKKED